MRAACNNINHTFTDMFFDRLLPTQASHKILSHSHKEVNLAVEGGRLINVGQCCFVQSVALYSGVGRCLRIGGLT